MISITQSWNATDEFLTELLTNQNIWCFYHVYGLGQHTRKVYRDTTGAFINESVGQESSKIEETVCQSTG